MKKSCSYGNKYYLDIIDMKLLATILNYIVYKDAAGD